MSGRSCFLIGHREASQDIITALKAAIEKHIVEYGVTEFIVGNYGAFDSLAANAVIKAKQQHPQISLTLLLPYYPSKHFTKMPAGFDGTLYPFGMESVPHRYAIVKANRYVIDHVDFLIAYVWHSGSNTYNLLEYAHRKKEKGLITITLLKQ